MALLLERLLGRRPDPLADRERRAARLDGKRRHLRARLSHNQRELHRGWTEYRDLDDRRAKRRLRARLRHLEAERKGLVKEMRGVQAEMSRLGFQSRAGKDAGAGV